MKKKIKEVGTAIVFMHRLKPLLLLYLSLKIKIKAFTYGLMSGDREK